MSGLRNLDERVYVYPPGNVAPAASSGVSREPRSNFPDLGGDRIHLNLPRA
jgi:hypothetical protein